MEAEWAAPLFRQRLGEDERAVDEVRERQRRRGPKRRAQVDRAEQSTARGPDDEADAERRPEQPEARRALFAPRGKRTASLRTPSRRCRTSPPPRPCRRPGCGG